MKPKPVFAWHWLSAPNTYAQGMKWSKTVEHRGDLELCQRGLHASERAIDSLQYAPGSIICRVECSGKIVRGDDKLVCSKRRVLWQVDAEKALRAFARRCASDVLHLWAAPQIVKDYLATGDESKRDAAWDAARAAAGAAARDAAWAAAWDAAAWDAARDAAGAAAWAAAWNAARAAAGAAAWDAARAAAWDAAFERYNVWLTEALLALEPKKKGAKRGGKR